jgi:hypothetical protein
VKSRKAARVQAQSMHTCEACGRRSYATRKHARRSAKVLFPGDTTIGAYQCREGGTCWHLGHLRPAVIRGSLGRGIYR